MQRTEFYKQYYHEMIRRGAEGLRNMNVELGSDDWLGPDGAPPIAGFPAPVRCQLSLQEPSPLTSPALKNGLFPI